MTYANLCCVILLCFGEVVCFSNLGTFEKLRARPLAARMNTDIDDCYDVVVIGGGIGGLSSAAVLSSNYKLRVGIFESHYHAGGVAHSFPIKAKATSIEYNFDSGPTIILGCSKKPYNPLRQVFDFVGASSYMDWIPYDSWGMRTEDGDWNFELGLNKFENGPLHRFGGTSAVEEFRRLRFACEPLVAGAAEIPTKALRGNMKLLPLLPYFSALQKVIPYADVLDGSFESLMKAHVRNPWLKSWLDALAFSLSGLPADQTGAAAMAYTLFDLHREGATLDYPRGGIGKIADVLVKVTRETGSSVHLSQHVSSVCTDDMNRVKGIRLASGRVVRATKGVICNANIWSLRRLLEDSSSFNLQQKQFLDSSAAKIPTKSFMHLHLGLDSRGLDLSKMQAHYTVMDAGLHCADPCADRNMVAVSNPSVLDNSLVNQQDKMVVHAYGAGNEDYDQWERFKENRSSVEYLKAKKESSAFLYRSVSRALGISEEEIRERSEVALDGSPLTHERFCRRYRGTYGAAWGEMLPGPLTPFSGLYLCGDSVFPGIGVPAVALSGASAAHSMISLPRHLWELAANKS